MASQADPPKSAKTGHGRQASHPRRQALLRQSTKGPLDAVEDPLTALSPQSSAANIQQPISASTSRTTSPAPLPAVRIKDTQAKDFQFLLKSDLFLPIDPRDVPAAFYEAPAQGRSIDALISSGRFRSAAVLAANLLKHDTDPEDDQRIFSLFYTRLVCLQLGGLGDQAAQESKALQDLNAPLYRDLTTKRHIVPWHLRVLVVRLQALGFGDWRRGIMGYYDLAREARIHIQRGRESGEDVSTWVEHLEDLGIRVANALIEMGDMDGAIHHLKTLPADNKTPDKNGLRIALLYLKAGDSAAAQHFLDSNGKDDASSKPNQRVLQALIKMADGYYKAAIDIWQSIRASAEETGDHNASIITQNLAVCLIYSNQIIEARKTLEQLTEQGDFSHGTLFNLATVYELCSDDAHSLKIDLARQAATQEPTSLGWEKANVDFKL